MKNQKAHQKSQLIREYGILMAPLVELARAEEPPPLMDYRVAIAKVQAGDVGWRRQVKDFTTFAQDVFFNDEYQAISHVPEGCRQRLKKIINDPNLQDHLDQIKVNGAKEVENADGLFFECIDRIPIEWEPVVFEANTPFTSYLRIKETIVAVKDRLHYFDRYLKPEFFELFLASVDRAVSIRLVTTAIGAREVAAVSNLARQEFADFQLIEVRHEDLHDRNLRVDDLIFSLGPGVDRAGMALTNFGQADSSTEAHTEFDGIIKNGRFQG